MMDALSRSIVYQVIQFRSSDHSLDQFFFWRASQNLGCPWCDSKVVLPGCPPEKLKSIRRRSSRDPMAGREFYDTYSTTRTSLPERIADSRSTSFSMEAVSMTPPLVTCRRSPRVESGDGRDSSRTAAGTTLATSRASQRNFPTPGNARSSEPHRMRTNHSPSSGIGRGMRSRPSPCPITVPPIRWPETRNHSTSIG